VLVSCGLYFRFSFRATYGNPIYLTLRDVDIVSWKTIKGRQGRVHIHAMLKTHIISPNTQRRLRKSGDSQMSARR
jgi:hypothetical protein